jgi:hypothetical protein
MAALRALPTARPPARLSRGSAGGERASRAGNSGTPREQLAGNQTAFGSVSCSGAMSSWKEFEAFAQAIANATKAGVHMGCGVSNGSTLKGLTILSFARRLSGDSFGGVSKAAPATWSSRHIVLQT